MWDIVKAGGIMMLPIILCSIVAMGIVIERLIVLRASKIAPASLMGDVWSWFKAGQLNEQKLEELQENSPLGQILAAALTAAPKGHDHMKESVEEAASAVIHKLERYLNALGTIAAISPLLGLLGTIFGLIEIFNAFLADGTANAPLLAGGISMALVTTASGLIVAIPSVFFHRFLLRRVDDLVVLMEQNVTKLVNAIDDEYQKQKENEKQLLIKQTKKEVLAEIAAEDKKAKELREKEQASAIKKVESSPTANSALAAPLKNTSAKPTSPEKKQPEIKEASPTPEVAKSASSIIDKIKNERGDQGEV